MNYMNISAEAASNFVAFIALLISTWTYFQTEKFNKRQNDFAKTAERLNQLLIAREEQEKIQLEKADIFLTSYNRGKGDYRIKVFNKGAGRATNVNILIIEGMDLIIQSDLNDKFPVLSMEQHQVVELICTATLNSSRKIRARITWDDATNTSNTREVWEVVF